MFYVPTLSELRQPPAESFEITNEQQAGFDILKCVLRHKSLCVLGVVIATVFGALYYAQQTPVYESTAKILIVNKRPESVGGGAVSYFNDYMSTHQALVISPVVIESALKREGLGGLRTEDVIGGLRVSAGSTSQGSNNILTLAFRGKVPAECVTVVNAVLASYQEFLEETYNSMSTNTLELMTEARDKLLVELRDQEQAYREFREGSPLISGSEDSPSLSRLAMIQSEQSQLLMKKTELESHLATIQKAKDEAKSEAYIANLIANLAASSRPPAGNSALTEAEKRQTMLLPLIQQEKQLLQHFGANHPAVASVQLRIRETRNAIEHPEQDTAQASDSLKYIEYLRQEIERVDTVQKLLTPIYETEFAAAKELTGFELRDQEFQRNMERTQQLYDGVIAQLQDAKLSKDYGGFKADVINPPQFGRKVEPRLSTVMLSSVVLGCMLGALLAFSADLIDSGFATCEELRDQAGLPVMGHIPLFNVTNTPDDQTESSGDLDLSLSAFHAPRSAETEAYRGLRTGLYFSNRGQSNKVIQITSPCPGDGKSTIASNLSVCIAQSGKSVLLIDADMRRPRQHDIFRVAASSGLSTIVAMDEELNDVVIESTVKNLWLLPAGPVPPDPAELLTSSKFNELINAVREQYDYVIIDTGPLLAISDPCIVSSQVDGLILAVRLKKTRRKQVARAKEILDSVGAPVIGIVANAIVGTKDKSYGYYYYGDYEKKTRNEKGVKSFVARTGASLRKITAT